MFVFRANCEPELNVFPTCVGMNWRLARKRYHEIRASQMRGDEPLTRPPASLTFLSNIGVWSQILNIAYLQGDVAFGKREEDAST